MTVDWRDTPFGKAFYSNDILDHWNVGWPEMTEEDRQMNRKLAAGEIFALVEPVYQKMRKRAKARKARS